MKITYVFVGFSLVLLVILVLGSALSAIEKGRFESASMDSTESRKRSIFIRKVLIESSQTDMPVPVEAWLEDVFELYQTLPIRKKKVGLRLCVLFKNQDNLNRRVFARFIKDGKEVGMFHRVSTGKVTTFVFEELNDFEFDGVGEVLFFERLGAKSIFGLRSRKLHLVE